MNNDECRFTIIVTVFNQENEIKEAIQSILNQKYSNFELILINDASTDLSLNVIENYAKKDSRIRVLSNPKNCGMHESRKIGVKYATGDWILFLDGDDSLKNIALEEIYKAIKLSKDTEVFEFGYTKIPQNEIILPQQVEGSRFEALFSIKKIGQTVWNKAYKSELLKKAFENMEDTNARIAEDYYESIVISFYAKTDYYLINKSLHNYTCFNGISLRKRDAKENKKAFSHFKIINKCITKFLKLNSDKIINIKEKKLFVEEKLFNDAIAFVKVLSKNNNEKIKSLFLLPFYFPIRLFIKKILK